MDEISSDLLNLQLALPNTPEFDPIRQTIADFLPRLVGQVAQAVLAELQSRTASLGAASALLTHTANEAAADARVLTFEKPKLIAAALKNAVDAVQQIRDAAKAGNFVQAIEKAQALQVLLSQAQTTIKG